MKNKEKLLEERYNLKKDFKELELSNEFLYIVRKGITSFDSLKNGELYIKEIKTFIEKRIYEIDKELGI